MFNANWTTLRPHKLQYELFNCDKRFVCVACGRQSGKSEISIRRLVLESLMKQNVQYPNFLYLSPTWSQTKRVGWAKIKQLLPKQAIKKISETELIIELKNNARIICGSAEAAIRLEGNFYNFCIIDESSDLDPAIFETTILPAISPVSGSVWSIGVPKRFGVGGSAYRQRCEEYDKLFKENPKGEYRYFHWTSDTVTKKEEIELLKKNMDLKTFQEQFMAEWLDIGSGVFYSFSDKNIISDYAIKKDKPILVGCDFNCSPNMSWVLAQTTDDDEGLIFFDEIAREDLSTTEDTLNFLWIRYGDHYKFEFYGDASSRQRSTNSSLTDYLIIKNYHKFQGKSFCYFPNKNPLIVDRVNSCNSLFQDSEGRQRCFVAKKCKKLIADIETASWREGTRQIDSRNNRCGHLVDALGYVIHYKFPLKLVEEQPISSGFIYR